MKRQPKIYMIEIDKEQPKPDMNQDRNFLKNLQTAVLLSLLEKGQLTKRQFDFCINEFQKT